MMFLKECPKGLDIWIQRQQQELHDYLIQLWGMHDKDYLCYGRAYRNRKETGYIPEVYKGKGEYSKDLFLNDKVKVNSFFGVGNEIAINSYKSHTAQVYLVMFVNLAKVSKVKHRPDAEIRLDVYNLLRLESHNMVMKSEVTGVERVLDEYPGRNQKDLVKFDMHPWHAFRFNMECTYDPNTQ